MNLKRLGNTEVMIPEIGLGTWRYRGGIEPLRKGLEMGATLIDTAEGYYTEDIVGDSIKGFEDKVIIATKVSGRNLRYDQVLKSAEASLIKLGVDQIHLYQIHWPNPSVPLSETVRAMEHLADEGLIKYIGVSNFDVFEMKETMGLLRNHPLVSNKVLYNLNSREMEYDLLPFCEENEITVLAYTPLDDGNLTRKGRFLSNNRTRVLENISKELNKTMAQIAINWCTYHPSIIAIPKSNSIARTIENCNASGWRITEEQYEILNDEFN